MDDSERPGSTREALPVDRPDRSQRAEFQDPELDRATATFGERLLITQKGKPDSATTAVRQMLAAIQPLIDRLSESINGHPLFHAEDPRVTLRAATMASHMEGFLMQIGQQLRANVSQELSRLRDIALESIDVERLMATLQALSIRSTYNHLAEDLEVAISEKEMANTIRALLYSGVIDEPNPIQLHELCAGSGIGGMLTGHLRKQQGRKTIIDLWDNRAVCEGVFRLCRDTFFRDLNVDFHCKDVTQGPIRSKEGVVPFWLAEAPEEAIGPIIERAKQISFQETTDPKGITIVPCLCHGYAPDPYPLNPKNALLSPEEWHTLGTFMASIGGNFGNILRASRDLNAKDIGTITTTLIVSAQVMNLARAVDISQHSKGAQARVQELFAGGSYALLIQPRGMNFPGE